MSKAVPTIDKEYQAEDDLRTLINAEKIKKDKARLSAAMKKHKEMMAAMQAVEGGKR